MDLSQYLEIFIDETKEHLQTLNDQVLILEAEPENIDTVNEIFRAAHSLKGMAGTMGFKRMQRLTHDMENVFSEIRNGKLNVNADMVDIVFKCLDAIEGYLTNIIESADEGTEDNEELIGLLNDALEESTDAAPAEEKKKEPEAEKSSSEKKADGDRCKFRNVPIADFEKNAMLEAKEKGMHVYAVTVYIQESCLLKEKFELDFSMFIVSEKSLDEIKKTIENVSEIEEAVIEEYEIPDTVTETAPKNEEPKNKVEEAPKPAVSEKKEEKKAPAKLDDLMNLVSELIIAKNGLVSVSGVAAANDQKFNEQIEYLERITTNLHESVMKTRMVPIESVVNRFPRMIRDLSKKLDKKMELYMTGEDTELDRTVIDEIGDPLMHLLRNSADHGLESAKVRKEKGKPEVGSIFLDAYQDGNNVVIEVRDDGAGIDVNKIRSKAIEKGTITVEQADSMTDKEIIELLFRPSFSTAEKITDVSGRGVGLDVVKSKIEALGGDVECHSVIGEGSTFTIRLPLTLAIIQALMVRLGSEQYAISLGSIQTVEDIPVEDVKFVQGKEVITLRGTVIPLIRLGQLLEVKDMDEEQESLTVVIIKKGDKQAGVVVDSLIGQMEIVIKSLGKYININKMISGATILGDGDIALIIDANAIV